MQETLLIIFTGIMAVAVLMQSILFLVMCLSLRQMGRVLQQLFERIDNISSKTGDAVAAFRQLVDGVKPIEEKICDAVAIVHQRVANLDKFLGEATDTARLEILRMQDTARIASRHIEETMELMRNSFMAPINELNAITRAIRATLDVLFSRRKRPSGASVQDEEMFI